MSQVLKDVARKRDEQTLEELEDVLRFEDESKPRAFMFHEGEVFELPLHKAPQSVLSLARLCHAFKVSRAMSFDGNRTLYASRVDVGWPAAATVH